MRQLASDAIALLKDMIAIPSPSFEEDEVCTYISGWLNDRSVSHERIGNNILAEHITDPDKPVLLLCAHIDTVTAGKDYSFDPFIPDYDSAAQVISQATGETVGAEEIVAGIGSNDDGASVVSLIAVFRYFKTRIPPINLVLVLTCEEERSGQGGMRSLWQILKDRYDRNGMMAIIGEPTGMKAATSERGLLVIDAEAHGLSGHAARNEGVNAVYIALEDIDRLRNHEFGKISPRMGKVHLNVTQINAGTAHNVIPDRCTFVIDIRPTEQYDNAELLEELQHICSSRLTARNLLNRSSATKEDSPLLNAAERLGIEQYASPTTSDWMRIDCDAIKMGPGDSSRSHKKDEFVFVGEIEQGIHTYIEFINHEYTLE